MSLKPIEGRCGQPLKNKKGHYCKNYPVTGRKDCVLHGGNSLVGAAHPNFKHGRRSKYKNLGRYAKAQEQHINDDKLLELYSEIALLTGRVQELASQAGDNEKQPDWLLLKKTWRLYQKANATRDEIKTQDYLYDVGELITQGATAVRQWQELTKTMDFLRKLIESERKRQIEANEMVKTELILVGVQALFAAFVESTKKHVNDIDEKKALIRAVNNEYAKIISIT